MLIARLSYQQQVQVLLALVLTSFLLITLVTFSSPFIPRINFLHIPSTTFIHNPSTTFGVFGYCEAACTRAAAYEWCEAINASLTGTMLIWPICMGFTLFTTISIIPLFIRKGNNQLFFFNLGVSTVSLFFAWLFSVFGWSVARRALVIEGQEADLGPSHWMGLAAMICI
ncbi:hypothetical protein CspHIS471_0704810 [Cutaneotrichosporon sp. HIS471]|nr:hypothetical protein CspHIS471_0704810 [Cutaneotrichosporon sp. HIS471]